MVMITRRVRRLVITVFIFFTVMVIGHYTGILRPVEYLLSDALLPAQKILFTASARINEWHQKRLKYDDLLVQNLIMEKELARLRKIDVKSDELARENQELKKFLDIKNTNGYVIDVATVIGRTSDGVQQTYILNKGRLDGVKIYDPVIVYEGIFIGKIIKVHEKTSIVRLLSDQSSIIAVSILNQDRTIGTVAGRQTSSMIMNLIPHHEVVYDGNTVITSGIDNKTPRGLVVGMIDGIIESPGELFKTAFIRPAVAYDRVVSVGIIKNLQSNQELE